ncbi:hypothetical protein [Mumia sp. Pv 4-285]|uniref:hypothetical protein n=1 Tax=Mumia qirimensis TaxID=3234852 RepID=UPI00351D9E94
MNRPLYVIGLIASTALVGSALVAAPPASADDVNIPPARTVSGGMNLPIGLDRDAAGNVYVASQLNNAVVVHASNASGPSGPLRVVTGVATGIDGPRDVAIDVNGFLYVVNVNGTVRIFAPGADGNVAPVKSFGTGAGNAFGVDVDPGGRVYVRKLDRYNVYVPSASGSPAPTLRSVTGLGVGFAIHVASNGVIWTPNGTQLRAYANDADGAAAPVRTIVDAFGATEVNGLDSDAAGRVYAASFFPSVVKVFSPSANGSVPPLKLVGGVATGLNNPTGIVVLASGGFAVANYNSSAYSVFARLFAAPVPPKPVVKVPGKPRALKVAGKKAAKKRTIRWKAPASNGGARITGYRLVVKKGSKTLFAKNLPAGKRSYKVKRSKLRNGKHVVFVKAKNSKGYGKNAQKVFRVRK